MYAPAFGTETKEEIEMRSNDGRLRLTGEVLVVSPEIGEGGQDYYSIVIRTYLENVGHEREYVLLFDKASAREVGGNLVFDFGVGKMTGGKLVKGSLCPFMPVDLKPGEVGKLSEVTIKVPDIKKFSSPRSVVYQISKDAAALHGLWSGRLEMKLDYEWPPKQ